MYILLSCFYNFIIIFDFHLFSLVRIKSQRAQRLRNITQPKKGKKKIRSQLPGKKPYKTSHKITVHHTQTDNLVNFHCCFRNNLNGCKITFSTNRKQYIMSALKRTFHISLTTYLQNYSNIFTQNDSSSNRKLN